MWWQTNAITVTISHSHNNNIVHITETVKLAVNLRSVSIKRWHGDQNSED